MSDIRVDGPLSRTAQQTWPGSIVYCVTAANQESWTLEFPNKDEVGLGNSYHNARQSLSALVASKRVRGDARAGEARIGASRVVGRIGNGSYPNGERSGPWFIQWGPYGFGISLENGGPGKSFDFKSLVLPVEIKREPGSIELKLYPNIRLEVMQGSPIENLLGAQRDISRGVLTVRGMGQACYQCSRDASVVSGWDDTVCPGCREYYCRNLACKRRLPRRFTHLTEKTRACPDCRTNHRYAGADGIEVCIDEAIGDLRF